MNQFKGHPFEVGDKVLLRTAGPETPASFTPTIEPEKLYVVRETLFVDGDHGPQPAVRLVGVFGEIAEDDGTEMCLFASHFISLADHREKIAGARRAQQASRKRRRPATAIPPPLVETRQSEEPASSDEETPAAREAAVATMVLLVNERKRLLARRAELEESSKRARTRRQLAAIHEGMVIDIRLAWLDRQLKAGIPIAGTSLVVIPT